MGYTHRCDACGSQYDATPPFMGEFRESWIKTADSPLTDAYTPGQTVTLCRDCIESLLL